MLQVHGRNWKITDGAGTGTITLLPGKPRASSCTWCRQGRNETGIIRTDLITIDKQPQILSYRMMQTEWSDNDDDEDQSER